MKFKRGVFIKLSLVSGSIRTVDLRYMFPSSLPAPGSAGEAHEPLHGLGAVRHAHARGGAGGGARPRHGARRSGAATSEYTFP